jgi:DNA polymerase III subunit epsilon
VDVLRMTIALDQLEGRPGDDYRLEAAAARFGVPVEEAHHALDDALMTAELFLVIATKLEARGYGTMNGFVRMRVPIPVPSLLFALRTLRLGSRRATDR